MKNTLCIVVVIFALLYVGEIKCQNFPELKFNHLNVENGLPQNSVYSIMKDKYGFMWFGTWGGAARFDGYSVKVFRPIENDTTSLSSYRMKAIVTDSVGNIWIETENKEYLYKYNYEGEDFTRFRKKDVPLLVRKCKVFSYGSAQNETTRWIATSSGLIEINKLLGDSIVIRYEQNNRFALMANKVSAVYLDDEDNLWVGTQSAGVNFASLYRKSFDIYNQHASGLIDNVVRAVCKDKQGRIWVGSENMGITIIDRTGKDVTNNYIGKEALCDLQVRSLYCDSKGLVWIGTRNGLMYYNPDSDSFFYCYKEYRAKLIYAITEDHAGRLWIGTMNGAAIYNPVTDRFKIFTFEGISDGIYVRSIIEDRNHNMWIATENLGVAKITLKSLADSPNQISIKRFVQLDDNSNSLPSDRTYSLTEDDKGMIWIATNFGLSRLDPVKEEFMHFSQKTGMPDNLIMSVLYDGDKSVWISHKKGLSRINTTTFNLQNFNIHDGLQGNEFNQNACFRDTLSGELLFGGTNGLNSFYPNDIQTNVHAPRVVFTGLNVMHQNVSPNQQVNGRIILEKTLLCTNEITLTNREKSFQLEFAALHYGNPSENKYQYRLVGYDQQWHYTDALNRTASYSNLPPGNYVLKVKAANSDGLWSDEPAIMQIAVLPPWWLTYWAIAAYLIFGCLVIWMVFNYVNSRIRLKRNELLHEAKLKFFTEISHEFRTPLTLIIDPLDKLLTGDTDKTTSKNLYKMMQRNARQLLLLINQLLDFRKLESGHLALSLQKEDIVPFVRNAVAAFESQAQTQKIALRVEASVDSLIVAFDEHKLTMILNNLLSNALKFTPENGRITVSIGFKDEAQEEVNIKVTDTGVGIPKGDLEKIFDLFYQNRQQQNQSMGSGIGLALTRELVQLHHGTIVVQSEINKGSSFTVSLPVVNEERNEEGIREAIFETKTASEMIQEPVKEQSELPIMLVVDDNADIRNYIKSHFETRFQILTAVNGIDGFNCAVDKIPDIVISDVMMPDMDGFEFSQKLKTDQRTSHIPIILLTALQTDESKTTGYITGADAYITKPFSTAVVQARVDNLLQQRQHLRALFSKGTKAEFAKVAVNSADEAFLEKLNEIIDRELDNPDFNIAYLSEMMHMSHSQLYRKTKALTDKTVSEFVTTCQMNKSVEYLSSGLYNVSEIAYKVGFSAPNSFTRAFQKHFGMSPTKYLDSRSEEGTN